LSIWTKRWGNIQSSMGILASVCKKAVKGLQHTNSEVGLVHETTTSGDWPMTWISQSMQPLARVKKQCNGGNTRHTEGTRRAGRMSLRSRAVIGQ
jgi:hypothetical protein